MLTSLRRSLMNTAMVSLPLMLSACGGGDDSNSPQRFEIVILSGLLMTIFVATELFKSRGRAVVRR
jgi:hypothetical protein